MLNRAVVTRTKTPVQIIDGHDIPTGPIDGHGNPMAPIPVQRWSIADMETYGEKIRSS